MILVFGPLADQAMANFTMLLLARKMDFLVLDPRTYAEEWDLVWWQENGDFGGTLWYGDNKKVSLSDVSALWAHMLGMPNDPKHKSSKAVTWEQMMGLKSLIESFPRLVVNRLSASATNSSKPYQQKIIEEHGFQTIKTLITSVPEEARKFYEAFEGQVIFKSISGVRSIVRRMTSDDLKRLDLLNHCPSQFQEQVIGTDVRVHVVGDRIFATEVDTTADDYRYVRRGHRIMRGYELPDNIRERCFKLAKSLNLIVCGIDLRRRLDGEYYCFEVNPMPGYIFYEMQSGQRIGNAVVDLLRASES